jgi:hypothetical protein
MMTHDSAPRPKARLAKALARAVAIASLTPLRTIAQGCAMCYQNAAAANSQGRTALQHGILILLLPALSLFLGIFGLMYLRRNTTR